MTDHYRPLKAAESLKTECSFDEADMEFGKPVKLPNIRRNHRPNPHARKSLEAEEGRSSKCSLEHTASGLPRTREPSLASDLVIELNKAFPRIHTDLTGLPNRECSLDIIRRDSLSKAESKKNLFKLPTEQIPKYRIDRILGRGSCAVVRLCVGEDGQRYAVKSYRRPVDADRKANLEREVSVLRQVSHPNLLSLVEVVETERSVHIVTELLETLSIADLLRGEAERRWSEATAKEVMRQVGWALQHLHSRNIVHRDLKLENILLSKGGCVKLIDFGFSMPLPSEHTVLWDFCGTPHYIAPEVVHKEGYLGKPADVWSFGVLLFRLTVGTFPFRAINEHALFTRILKADLRLPLHLSPSLRSLLAQLLHPDFRKRPPVEEILRCEWFQS